MDYNLVPPDVEGLKGALEVFKEQSEEIRSVPPVVFFGKTILKIFWKFLENYLRQSTHLKPI